MGIRHLKLLLVAAMGIAGGIGAGGWWLGYGGNQQEVREEEREREVVLKDKGMEPRARAGNDGLENPTYDWARFEGRRWQRLMIDPPAAVVVAPVAVTVPMVQLPPEIQLAGVLVGTTPESSSAFLKVASGPVEVVRNGSGLKARPDVVVTEITSHGVTVRYQGQLFPLKLPTGNSVFRRAE